MVLSLTFYLKCRNFPLVIYSKVKVNVRHMSLYHVYDKMLIQASLWKTSLNVIKKKQSVQIAKKYVSKHHKTFVCHLNGCNLLLLLKRLCSLSLGGLSHSMALVSYKNHHLLVTSARLYH